MKTSLLVVFVLSLLLIAIPRAISSVADIQDIRQCVDLASGSDSVFINCMSQYDIQVLDQDLENDQALFIEELFWNE